MYMYSRLASVSDLMRLEILYRHGGVYIDTNYEAYRTVEPFLNYSMILFYEHPTVEYLANLFIASEPSNPYL